MSYQVLARKWRPKDFSVVIGQESVCTALTNALNRNEMHHAYLFTGTRGVGKTSIARIVAKCLNCRSGVSATPCNTCDLCTSIDNGSCPDLIEIDAASRTKVEDTREILENIHYLPTIGSYKVYLIDEVHMLSMHSFNALLKTLEEPPEHVKFLLATTDPQKLPITVLSRCVQLHLKLFSVDNIIKQIDLILAARSIIAETGAMQLLARMAQGSMRDALSLLEQVLSYSNGNITVQHVRDILGVTPEDKILALLAAVHANDSKQTLAIIAELAEYGVDFNAVLADFLIMVYQLTLAQTDLKLVENNLAQEGIVALAQQIATQDLRNYYKLAINGRRDMPYAPDPRIGFEITLLQMLDPEKSPTSEIVKTIVKTIEKKETTESNVEWHEIVPKLKLSGLVKIVAEHCIVVQWLPEQIQLQLDPRQEIIFKSGHDAKIAASLSDYLDVTVTVKINIGVLTSETPAIRQDRIAGEAMQQARKAIESDLDVNNIVSAFDATIAQVLVKESDK